MNFHATCQNLLDEYVSQYRAGNAAGCAACYAVDAELYSPFGPPAIGRDSIAAMHMEWVKENAQSKQIEVLNSGHIGDLGWCTANFHEGSEESGISLNVLARQPDGRWLITHTSLNAV